MQRNRLRLTERTGLAEKELETYLVYYFEDGSVIRCRWQPENTINSQSRMMRGGKILNK